ncbi:CDP-glucose 4,6-dehydratase [Paenibacillus sp. NPDC058177]|uniref:CDP-glucose 4,6-dehydratase n=1 Tax=Paenibacillus sp. NPDC058177 TaxID=3346369 RepID=UPI0036DE4E01
MKSFWENKRILITGHTGFKGSWLSLWLQKLGAQVTGYSLAPPTTPNLFTQAEVKNGMTSIYGDIRDLSLLKKTISEFDPEIIFHMAAQSLVRRSYQEPVETFSANVMGTVNLFEAARDAENLRAIINITSDKCYENKEWQWGYREIDPMGGYDPYSASKGCAELVTASYRRSFYNDQHKVAIASVRAGNVIGGGDWAEDRLIPDLVRSIQANKSLKIRNPHSVRPWQHVLEPLYGYLLLAEKMWSNGEEYSDAWNIGPSDYDAISVEALLSLFQTGWKQKLNIQMDDGNHPHEAGYLKLDCSKARLRLGWKSNLSIQQCVQWVVAWTYAYLQEENIREFTLDQITSFEELIKEHK